MRRRDMLLAVAGLGLLGAVGWRVAHVTEEDGVEAVIYKRLGYLKLDKDGVRRFARDYVAQGSMSGAKLRAVAAASGLYRRMGLDSDNAFANGIRHGEDRIVTKYLLSTDFFRYGADENNSVQYVVFFDALQGCCNPFARPLGEPGDAAHCTTSSESLESGKCLSG